MDISKVKSITIPEGNVIAISIGGKQVWLADIGTEGLTYALRTGGSGCTVTGYTGTDPDVVIPSTYVIDDVRYAVVGISPKAFSSINYITSIKIPDSVTYIDDRAFAGCSSVASIKIPDSVTSIGDYAFTWCNNRLTSITIPDSVTSMGMNIFNGCTNLITIYCEAQSQPSGWASDWKGDCNATVVFGYKG